MDLIFSYLDTLFGDDLYCICFDHPNRETAMQVPFEAQIKIDYSLVTSHCGAGELSRSALEEES